MLLHTVTDRITKTRTSTAVFLWLILFVLYFPAAKSGFVSDTTGWVQSLGNDSFWDYINRTHFSVKSMYQVTQFNTWVLFQLVGKSAWSWHLIHLTLHAANCYLLYLFCSNLFAQTGLDHAKRPAFIGALLFGISPYASEVVVWEGSFHYLQALLLVFSILILVQRFQDRPTPFLAMLSGLLFLVSTYTLELFYLTPIFVFTLAFFYRSALNYRPVIFRKTILYIVLPQVFFFLLHLYVFRLIYGGGVAHLGDQLFKNPLPYFLVRPPWYSFHLVCWGRFFPPGLRKAVYDVFRTPAGALIFYTVLTSVCGLITIRYRKMQVSNKLASLLLGWLILALAIATPLFFPEILLVACDRYLYLMLAFYWMLVSLLLYRIKLPFLYASLVLLVSFINGFLLLKLSVKWKESTELLADLQNSPLLVPGKVKILLNSPASLQGIPLIGIAPEGEFRLMHNLFFSPPITDTMLEVAAYNMSSKDDGAFAEFIDDRTVLVTFKNWETTKWMGSFQERNYENNCYRMEWIIPSRSYKVILKKPASEYQLLYQEGNQLKSIQQTGSGKQQ